VPQNPTVPHRLSIAECERLNHREVTLGNNRVHYIDEGQGFPLVLVRSSVGVDQYDDPTDLSAPLVLEAIHRTAHRAPASHSSQRPGTQRQRHDESGI